MIISISDLKSRSLLFLGWVLIFFFAFAGSAANASQENDEMPYVEVTCDNAPLYFFDHRTVQGEPAMELNKKGLFQKGRKICAWNNLSPDGNCGFGSNLEECDPSLPFYTIEIEIGGGTYSRFRVTGESDTIAELKYKGKSYFLKVSGDHAPILHKSPKDQRDKKVKLAKRFLEEHPEFKSFSREFSKCLRQESSKCIKKFIRLPLRSFDPSCGEDLPNILKTQKNAASCLKNAKVLQYLSRCLQADPNFITQVTSQRVNADVDGYSCAFEFENNSWKLETFSAPD